MCPSFRGAGCVRQWRVTALPMAGQGVLLKAHLWRASAAGGVARTEISDEAWVVIGPLFPVPKATGGRQ